MSCSGQWVMTPCNPTNPMASEIAKEKCPIPFRMIELGLYLSWYRPPQRTAYPNLKLQYP
jgi:hypothetical protein